MRGVEKELVKATKPFAKEDRGESWRQLFITFSLFVVSLIFALEADFLFLQLTGSLLLSLLLVRLFAIYHDYLHGAILRKSLIARLFFIFYGYYTLNPPSIWKRSHDYHHQHNSKLFTSSIGSFPILTAVQFEELDKVNRFKYLFIRHPLTILFGYFFTFWIGMCLSSLIRNPKKHWDSALALFFHCGMGWLFYAFGGWNSFFVAFFIPALVSSALGSYLFYVQHNFVGAIFKSKDTWSRVGAAIHSTSFLKLGPIMNWFTGNIGYHHVHHLNALIPFYKLPEAHEKFTEIQAVKTSSLRVSDIIKCLKLKVWDSDKGELRGLAGSRF